jgi:uncharacterized protein YbaR (Trm112 family)
MNIGKLSPLCPHCKNALVGTYQENGIIYTMSGIKIRAIICPKCEKTIHYNTKEKQTT